MHGLVSLLILSALFSLANGEEGQTQVFAARPNLELACCLADSVGLYRIEADNRAVLQRGFKGEPQRIVLLPRQVVSDLQTKKAFYEGGSVYLFDSVWGRLFCLPSKQIQRATSVDVGRSDELVYSIVDKRDKYGAPINTVQLKRRIEAYCDLSPEYGNHFIGLDHLRGWLVSPNLDVPPCSMSPIPGEAPPLEQVSYLPRMTQAPGCVTAIARGDVPMLLNAIRSGTLYQRLEAIRAIGFAPKSQEIVDCLTPLANPSLGNKYKLPEPGSETDKLMRASRFALEQLKSDERLAIPKGVGTVDRNLHVSPKKRIAVLVIDLYELSQFAEPESVPLDPPEMKSLWILAAPLGALVLIMLIFQFARKRTTA